MLLQANNKNRKRGTFSAVLFPKNHKGLSLIIGYVLLIAVSIVISVMVYQFLKTYVPKETVACHDGTSFLVKDISCTNSRLSVTLENNGKFGIHGYYISISNDQNQKLATIDLSGKIKTGGEIFGNSIAFSSTDNSFTPGDSMTSTFDVSNMGMIFYTAEIIPTRQEIIDNVKRFARCGDAKVTIKDPITCTA